MSAAFVLCLPHSTLIVAFYISIPQSTQIAIYQIYTIIIFIFTSSVLWSTTIDFDCGILKYHTTTKITKCQNMSLFIVYYYMEYCILRHKIIYIIITYTIYGIENSTISHQVFFNKNTLKLLQTRKKQNHPMPQLRLNVAECIWYLYYFIAWNIASVDVIKNLKS